MIYDQDAEPRRECHIRALCPLGRRFKVEISGGRISAAGAVAPIPAEGWPTDTYTQGRRRKLHNGEAVEIFCQPNATTDGNSIVHFRRSDVIVTGDIFNSTSYPFIDVRAGGSLRGEIAALNNILDKTVSWRQEGGTMIIPGHGRLCNEWEVTEYRDMMLIIRDRVQAMINDKRVHSHINNSSFRM